MAFDLVGKAVKNLRLPTVDYNNSPIKIIPAQEGDINSRFFSITLFDDRGDIPLSLYTRATLNATLPDGELQIVEGEVNYEKNVVICKIAGSMLAQLGKVSCDVLLIGKDGNGDNTSLTSQTFYVFVAKSQAGDDAIEGSDDYALLVQLFNEVSELEDNIESAEEARVAAEQARVAAEKIRASNETTRVNAEDARATAEYNRESAETKRASAEIIRAEVETARASDEIARAEAETARAEAETARAEAAIAMAEAEATRETNEETRAAAERDRASAESARATNETTRNNAETVRQSAEEARVAAEQAREETIGDINAKVTKAAENAEEAVTKSNDAVEKAEEAIASTDAVKQAAAEVIAQRVEEIANDIVNDLVNEAVNNAVGGYALPKVTAEDDGKVLRVVDGTWQAAELVKYLGEYEEVT